METWSIAKKAGIPTCQNNNHCSTVKKKPKNSDTRKICCNYAKSWTVWFYDRVMHSKATDGMANSIDPDQTAPLGAVWSGSTLFAYTCPSKHLGSLPYLQRYFFLLYGSYSNFHLLGLLTKIKDLNPELLRKQSDQRLLCLPFFLHPSMALCMVKPQFKFLNNYSKLFGCPNYLEFYGTYNPGTVIYDKLISFLSSCSLV